MSSHKNQHYVPRCHLRPFSLDAEGAAINLFNIRAAKFVRDAPVKNQCSKDYFYGKDNGIEHVLGKIEGRYSEVLNKLQNEFPVGANDLSFIKDFMFLQSRRTQVATTTLKIATLRIKDAVTRGGKYNYEDLDFTHKDLLKLSLNSFIEGRKYIHDLKPVIVKNRTTKDFITSDDPAGIVNRYYVDKLNRGDYGLMNSGTVLFMPLTPRLYALAYDKGVYSIPAKEGFFVEVRKDLDVSALNQLQYIRASANLYFLDWEARAAIYSEFQEVEPARLATGVTVKTFVLDSKEHLLERYKIATDEVYTDDQEGLVSVGFNHPVPSDWISGLRFRDRPKVYSNGSAVGLVRKPEWLTSEGRGEGRRAAESAFPSAQPREVR